MMHNREEYFRNEYLRKLKERSMTIDYGSHQAFQENVNKSLIDRKKQEWQSDRDMLNYQLKSLEQDEMENYKKNALKHMYKDELQRQLHEREEEKKLREKHEIEE